MKLLSLTCNFFVSYSVLCVYLTDILCTKMLKKDMNRACELAGAK